LERQPTARSEIQSEPDVKDITPAKSSEIHSGQRATVSRGCPVSRGLPEALPDFAYD
jgi:hypothetical protein